ncbi:unnamed protein product [Protopolystoma xenopodis]|uniref:Uncharacterized protein n=1 Tax=Protopolystoma xenopodis TaxID=117903 RepID=A0A448WIR0_9PLAT|nr:unnamed protein product [Protopolystoma xenopodis]
MYTPSLQADIDPDVSSNLSAKAYFSSPVSKIDKSHKPIIYRPEDIARLLDRSRMTWESTDRPPGLLDDENNGSSATTAMASSGVLAESAETTSVYDFFAGTFKVAHFDDVPSANAVDRVCGTLAKQSEADEEETGAQEGREDGDTEECKQLAENVDKSQSSISSSSFWDRLLRERYQRLVSLEQERHRERRIITYTHGVPMEITEPVSPSTANGSGCTGMEADEINEAKAEAKPAELFSRRAKSGRSFLFPLGRTNLVDNGFGIDYEEEEEEDRMEDEDADLRLVRRIQRPSRTGVVSGYGGEGTNQRRLADRSWGLASQRKLLGLKDISRTRDSDEDWTPPGAELGEADDDDDDEEWMAEEYPAVPRRFSDQVKLGRTAGMQNRMAKHKKNAMTT